MQKILIFFCIIEFWGVLPMKPLHKNTTENQEFADTIVLNRPQAENEDADHGEMAGISQNVEERSDRLEVIAAEKECSDGDYDTANEHDPNEMLDKDSSSSSSSAEENKNKHLANVNIQEKEDSAVTEAPLAGTFEATKSLFSTQQIIEKVLYNCGQSIFGRLNFVPTLCNMKNAILADYSQQNKYEASSSIKESDNKMKQIEETGEKWDELFMNENNWPKKKWLCPERIENDRAHNEAVLKCEYLRFANKAFRKYLLYHILRDCIQKDNEFKGNEMVKIKKDKQQAKEGMDSLFALLALKPKFVHFKATNNNNLAKVKIILLKAYKHFNIGPAEDVSKAEKNLGNFEEKTTNLAEEFEKITGNFANKTNCEKVLKLSTAFKRSKALEYKYQENNSILKRHYKQSKKYRKALKKIKNDMKDDEDFCTNCEIPSVEELLLTNSLKISPKFAEYTKELKQKFTKKFDEKFKMFSSHE